jgi:acyl CoA:acetate/3-ketoacid CoA transferase
MGFKPIISDELRTMDAKIFNAGPMNAVTDVAAR